MLERFELGVQDSSIAYLLNHPDTSLISYKVVHTVISSPVTGDDVFSELIVEYIEEEKSNELIEEGVRRIEVYNSPESFNECYNDPQNEVFYTEISNKKGYFFYLIDYLEKVE